MICIGTSGVLARSSALSFYSVKITDHLPLSYRVSRYLFPSAVRKSTRYNDHPFHARPPIIFVCVHPCALVEGACVYRLESCLKKSYRQNGFTGGLL